MLKTDLANHNAASQERGVIVGNSFVIERPITYVEHCRIEFLRITTGITRRSEGFVVCGEIVSNSTEPLCEVTVIVDVYDLKGVVIDTESSYDATVMRPGESKCYKIELEVPENQIGRIRLRIETEEDETDQFIPTVAACMRKYVPVAPSRPV